MDHQHQATPFLRLVSVNDEPSVKVDIIHGLSGYEFSRMRLTAALGSTVLWTNRTRAPQVIQLDKHILELAPAGKHGSTALTHFDKAGQFAARLESNPVASIAFIITGEFTL